jgi:type II secretory ATPase GspE/PulE/Tfp pilus assembly ATPase PilB-like protein
MNASQVLEDELARLQSAGEASVPDLVNLLIRQAVSVRASDIHLEPTDSEVVVRFRIDGVLQRVASLGPGLRSNLVARVKVMSNLLTYRTDIPQEGRIDASVHGGPVDLRVSTFPTIHGEKVVIRIFDPRKRTFETAELGMREEVRQTFERHISRPQGLILLTGPSGSGKTTTIYSALRAIAERGAFRKNIVTIEDPVEHAIPGVTQTQINLAAGLTFARSLRSLLRQDPEVIMVGEIRDAETAKIAVEAGLTGHLVLSTIHSGTACGVFHRLLEMDVEPFLIASSVGLVLAQRLVRVLCPKCKAPATDEAGVAIFKPMRCPDCLQTGYGGRTLLAELLEPNEDIKQAVMKRSLPASMQSIAQKAGMKTLNEEGLDLVRRGVTSAEELKRVLGEAT